MPTRGSHSKGAIVTLTLTTTQHAALVEDYADRHAGEFATRAAARKYGVHVITRRWGKVAAAGWISVPVAVLIAK